MVDNFELVLPFCPEKEDGDTFIYTEMLNRGKRKGNNGHRLLKTFYHRSQEEFRNQWPEIRALCDMSQVRAMTRLAPRSYNKVGENFVRLVVDTALSKNWAGMKSLYNRACGTTSPNMKVWLFDMDELGQSVDDFGAELEKKGVLLARIPSKKGVHFITRAFDRRGMFEAYKSLSHEVHKDNPTNLYIPEGAD